MFLRVCSIFAISTLLLSCSMDRGPFYNGDQSYDSSKMAGLRGLNPQLMDEKLQGFIKETESIELRVATLLTRLNYLRDEISAYGQTRIETISEVVQNTADTPPQVILPVPDRKTIQAETSKTVVKTKSVKPKAKTLPKKNGVYNVRYGAHKDKTRLVFDINGSTNHEMSFDKEAGIVTIMLPGTQWSTKNSQTYKSSQLSGYEAKSSGQGTIIAMAVKGTSSVKTSKIGKSGSNPSRLVIDLMK
jgi:hypothetical protein